ncbi:hypothetical protein DXG01_012555 [Tephrocybe rancida]|nr:hypothetical protein DXG01_012555 [Tephrocybe rancida]
MDVNAMVGRLSAFASEVTRVSSEVGTEGRLGGVGGAGGGGAGGGEGNHMALSLTNPAHFVQEVAKAIVGGFMNKIEYDVRCNMLELKDVVNGMAEFFSDFVDEITRVAREVRGEERLGGRLTLQTRSVGAITSVLAPGEIPPQILGVAVNGEMRTLVDSTNHMIDQLAIFASEITKVAMEVGMEGKPGVQAAVGNAQSIWREITLSVNTPAERLTTQSRGFAQITAAVLNHGFTLFITDEDSGETDSLKTQTILGLWQCQAETAIVSFRRLSTDNGGLREILG